MIPEHSDLKFGFARWDLESQEGGTRVVYDMKMKPDFWIPPLIGSYLLKRSLTKAGGKAAQRVEDLALGKEIQSGHALSENASTHE